MKDYAKDMFKQLEEQAEQIEHLTRVNTELREENKQLRKENTRLNQRLDVLEASLSARIEKAAAEAVGRATRPLHMIIDEQKKIIARQSDEIVRLKKVIDRDSSNSSKPPSSDGYKKPIVNSRERSGKKPGGQRGHQGHSLKKPANWEELVEKGLAQDEIRDYACGSREYRTRYTFDISPIQVKWIESRYLPGAKELREQPQQVIYGENIKAFAVYLMINHIPQERACELIRDITHNALSMSEGTYNNIIQQFSGRLGSEITVIKRDLLNGRVMHTDETAMRSTQWEQVEAGKEGRRLVETEHTSALVYLRTHSNEKATLITVNRHKDMAGVDLDDILTRFHGILSHDHDRKYYHYGTEHATCGAHLERELKGLAEGYGIEWAQAFRGYLSEMNAYKKADIKAHVAMPEGCDPEQYLAFAKRYDELVEQGKTAMEAERNRYARTELGKMLERLQKYKTEYLLFMKKYIAPFTNNLAERDLRPCKGKQKVSGCFRSWSGIVAYVRIRSFLSTIRKRGVSTFNAICSVFRGVPVLTSAGGTDQ